MTPDIIKRIRGAEAAAAELGQKTRQEARELIADARRRGEAHIAASAADSAAKTAEALRAANESAEATAARSEAESKAECAKLRSEAAGRMAEAVQLVIEGIMVKCR